MIRLASLVVAFTFICFSSFVSINPVESSPFTPVPANFEDVAVTNVPSPTALAFTPDGRLLITTQPGQIRVYQNGTLLAMPALNLNSRLCTNSERGLLGIAVDPQFASNRYIYLYYTFKKTAACDGTAVNRVARFTLPDTNIIDTASELVLIDNIHSTGGNHNGGDLHFGKDGLLYISVGDAGCDYAGNSGCAGSNDAARDRHVLLGKILRITRDGRSRPAIRFRGPVPEGATSQALQRLATGARRLLRAACAIRFESPLTLMPPRPVSSSTTSAKTHGRK